VLRIFDNSLKFLTYLAGIILVFITLSVTFDVIMRYILNRPSRWIVDISEYALVFILFLSAGWTLAEGGHVEISLVVGALPRRLQRVLNVITSALGALVCGLLLWKSIDLIWELYEAQDLFFKSLVIPKWTVFTVVPIGFLTMFLQFIRRILQLVIKTRDPAALNQAADPMR
jgi:TRAP-type C4-dicarboxylate transport system permease small subunit